MPWIFKGDNNRYTSWRDEIANIVKINASDVFIVGSAATGYSLSPLKAGRPFRFPTELNRLPSDIDLALVCPHLFTIAWNEMIKLDRKRVLSKHVGHHWEDTWTKLEHARVNIYWGFFPSQLAAPGTTTARRLRMVFSATSRNKPFLGHRVSARLYRRYEDMMAYHLYSIRALKERLERSEENHETDCN